MADLRQSLPATMKHFLRSSIVTGLLPNLKKCVIVLAVEFDRTELNKEFKKWGINIKSFQVGTHGKYLGVMIGPTGPAASWQLVLVKFLSRIGHIKTLKLGLVQNIYAYNSLAFSILTYLMQVLPVRPEVIRAETNALQRLTMGPRHAIPTLVLKNSLDFGFPVEPRNLQATNKAAMFRIALQSSAFARVKERLHFLEHEDVERWSVAFLQLHEGTAAELWHSARAALRTVAGVQDTQRLGVLPRFFFTKAGTLRGTDTDGLIQDHLETSMEQLQDLKRAARAGQATFGQLLEWLPRVAPGLLDADLVVCSEPFWLCPPLAALRAGPMAGVLHMALLNEFPFEDEASLDAFWVSFYAMAERHDVVLSVACRITAEQVLHQTALQVPYVPFLGLHVRARHSPGPARRALLFRNNRQHMIAFRGALRHFLAKADPPCPVELVDMNDRREALPYEEMATFHMALLLPHGPSALRLTDLYAAAVPMLVPAEPLVHKFVWATRTFGGYDSEPRWRHRAPQSLRAARGEPAGGWHPYSPLNFVHSWAIHRHIDDRRYWYQYTEWATLPHLVTFSSLPDLLLVMEGMTLEEVRRVSTAMTRHHLSMVADALGWWRAALCQLTLGM
ncbi:unnamed protein product [Prorocentrum cordatum]|uniref:Uncharacterized protein n=1 Tax=Prorocentrum cordatum TaxID=2364126 RepID=A0ABN9T9J0_9DINO|nr:unnamed protein product [Polarella glacialis]